MHSRVTPHVYNIVPSGDLCSSSATRKNGTFLNRAHVWVLMTSKLRECSARAMEETSSCGKSMIHFALMLE